jgi:hypothetical protein
MIIAIIAGPILAVQVQKLIERIRWKHEEKRKLFVDLMSTRGRPLLLQHVHSLNMIDVIFSGKRKRDVAVVEAWSVLREHFYDVPRPPLVAPGIEINEAEMKDHYAKLDTWGSKRNDLLVELLDKMAVSLGYHFDPVLLKKGAYTPQGYVDLELAQQTILGGFMEIFQGKRLFPVFVVHPSNTEKTAPHKKDKKANSPKN